MERRPHHKPNEPRRPTNIDGFVVNRRGRNLNPSFKKATSDSISPTTHKIIEPEKRIPKNPINQSSVTWTPRMQDPSKVPLTRKENRKAKKAKKRLGKHYKAKRFTKIGILAAIALFLIVSGVYGYKIFGNIDKVFGGNIFSNLGSLLSTTTLKGQDTGRVNILLAGDSADDPNHQGAQLTDSILILSVDVNKKTAFLLSIPRDLWVKMPSGTWPGGTYQKINAANEITNFNQPGYPSGGMGALEYVVKNDLNIPIDYYGLMNYTAFRDSVDAVGGVTITVNSPDPRGLFDPNTKIKLANGSATLNGREALDLARSRGDGYGSYGFPNSDFDRTTHQRQIFIAVANKAKSLGVISNPSKINALFGALGKNLQTDLNLSDVLALIHITSGINLNSVQSYSFNYSGTNPILKGYYDPASGQDSLIPAAGIGNYNQLQLYYQKLTSSNPVIKEGATVSVENGGNITGLAKAYQTKLTAESINVVSANDAVKLYPQTEIMDNSNGNDPATKALLEKMFGTNLVSNNPYVNTGSSSFVVFLGENQSLPPITKTTN